MKSNNNGQQQLPQTRCDNSAKNVDVHTYAHLCVAHDYLCAAAAAASFHCVPGISRHWKLKVGQCQPCPFGMLCVLSSFVSGHYTPTFSVAALAPKTASSFIQILSNGPLNWAECVLRPPQLTIFSSRSLLCINHHFAIIQKYDYCHAWEGGAFAFALIDAESGAILAIFGWFFPDDMAEHQMSSQCHETCEISAQSLVRLAAGRSLKKETRTKINL